MRGILLLLAVVVLAVLLVQASMEDPGYVLISRAPHEVEISLSLFLFVLLVVVHFECVSRIDRSGKRQRGDGLDFNNSDGGGELRFHGPD